MSPFRLVAASLLHYRWIHLSVLAGVALTSAILSGALVVGDSVKESLRRNAEARLGGAGPALIAGERFVTAALADRIADRLGEGPGSPALVAPVLQIEGTAANREAERRINRVQIVGVDERFWRLSPGGEVPPGFEDERWTGINAPFADRIAAAEGDRLILRVELPGTLSRDAPLSGESEQTVPFTVTVDSVLDAAAYGLYSLRAEQVPPSTLFMRLSRLQELLEQEDLANVLLGEAALEATSFAEAAQASWALGDVQLALGETGLPGVAQVSTSRVFFDPSLVEAVSATVGEAAPALTYLATTIAKGDRETPYSMVAGTAPGFNALVDESLDDGSILLSDWLAEDLEAAPGDEVTLVYNVVGPGRSLVETSRSFRVAGALPLAESGWNATWTPEFPGIFDVDNLDDWEPGIPVDRDRIRPKDDEYWDLHRATPKAFVSLAAARSMWTNRFGDSTAIRFREEAAGGDFAAALRPRLALESLGMATRDLPAESAAAVADSFDFGALFASMSFFLIAAALTLTALVFVFGVEQRASQIGLYLALGIPRGRVRRWFFGEAALLATVGAALGLLGGIVYTRLALGGMSGVWREAAAGIEFVYHRQPATLLVAYAATVATALLVVWLASRRVSAVRPSQLISGGGDEADEAGRRPRWDLVVAAAGLLGGLGCLLAPKEPGTIAEQGLFFGAGFLLTLGGVGVASILIRRQLRPSQALASLGALGRQHAVRRRGRSLAVVGLMAAGVFMTTAINSFRLEGERGSERRASGTGGFAYLGESTVPVYEDLNSADGRERYGLDALDALDADGADNADDEGFAFVPFRVSDGEDASCLNLNRAQRPRLMGVDPGLLAEREAFTFTREAGPGGLGWGLLEAGDPGGEALLENESGLDIVPGVIDQNTATYALQRGVGDLVRYETASGRSFAVRIAGFLDTSVLQGSLLISEDDFVRFFPDAGGYRYFLLDGGSVEDLAPVAAHLTRMFGDLGLEMRPAADRLNEFNAVQNTYLSIFSTLGGLGIFLGTLGLAVMVGRNVMERRGQLGVMQAIGFTRERLARMVVAEHGFLHLSGVALGLAAAAVAVAPQLTRGLDALPLPLLAGVNGAVLLGGLAFCWVAARLVLRGQLMEAIRRE